jgi:hypothetical protein
MTTITAALLLAGGALAGFGVLAFLAAAPGWPDVETLRLTYLAALHGRRLAAAGIASWAVAHPTVPAPCVLLILAAGIAATAACLPVRAAPALMRRAAAWSY